MKTRKSKGKRKRKRRRKRERESKRKRKRKRKKKRQRKRKRSIRTRCPCPSPERQARAKDAAAARRQPTALVPTTSRVGPGTSRAHFTINVFGCIPAGVFNRCIRGGAGLYAGSTQQEFSVQPCRSFRFSRARWARPPCSPCC